MVGYLWIALVYGPFAFGALCAILAFSYLGDGWFARRAALTAGALAAVAEGLCLTMMYLRTGRILTIGFWAALIALYGLSVCWRARRLKRPEPDQP